MHCKKAFILLVLSVFCLAQVKSQNTEAVYSLITAEKEFAYTIQEEGIREGFLDFLDKAGLVYTPKATEAIRYYRKLDADSANLTFYAEKAHVSEDGLLGYTVGIFEYRDDILDTEPSENGHYVSIWRREDRDKDWKMLLNIGIEHSSPKSAESIDFNANISPEINFVLPYELDKSKQILLDSDELLNVSKTGGRTEFVFDEFYNDSSIVFRQFYPPFYGKKAIEKFQLQMKGRYKYDLADGYLTPSRDIAYTFGTGVYHESIQASTFDQWFSYVRIWRKGHNGLWKVMVDIEKPFSKTAE